MDSEGRTAKKLVSRSIRALSLAVLSLSVVGPTAIVQAAGECTNSGPGGDWPFHGKDLAHSRYQDQETIIGAGNAAQLEAAWVLPADGTFESHPVAAGGCVFIGTQTGHIYALEAASGGLVWDAQLPTATTLSVANGRVFIQSGADVTALDADTGAQLWRVTITEVPGMGDGSGAVPTPFEDMVIAGAVCGDDVIGTVAPRGGCKGYYAILDQATGERIVDGYDVSQEDFERGMGGSGFWIPPTYDSEDKLVYWGNANARTFNPENPNASALLKIDADPLSPTFGQILGAFRTTELEETNIGNNPAVEPVCRTANNIACTNEDDWAAPAIIYRNSEGEKLIASAHRNIALALNPDFSGQIWSQPAGARAAGAAYDGSSFYFQGAGSTLVALDKDTGAIEWTGNVFGSNTYQHVSAANGVVYTLSGSPAALAGGTGFLLAWDASDGTPLVQRQMTQDIGDIAIGTVAGGVAIAQNTVFAPVNGTQGGYLVAYRLPSE